MRNPISFALLLSALAGAATSMLTTRMADNAPVQRETAYERVIRTQTLRCGYVTFVPNLIKDPNTGIMSGVDYDIAEALGRKLGMKIDWAEEVGWATVVPGLKVGKYDALCSGNWINPKLGQQAYFSRPYYYQGAFVVVRADDVRFDKDVTAINKPDVRVASLDGDNPKFIAEEDFPKAQIFTLPDMAGEPMVMESVALRKADVTFMDAYNFGTYDDHNRGKLKLTQLDHPVRLYPAGYVLPAGDDRLRAMINTALDEMIYSGQMEKILQRYAKYPYSFTPIERPKLTASVAPNSVP